MTEQPHNTRPGVWDSVFGLVFGRPGSRSSSARAAPPSRPQAAPPRARQPAPQAAPPAPAPEPQSVQPAPEPAAPAAGAAPAPQPQPGSAPTTDAPANVEAQPPAPSDAPTNVEATAPAPEPSDAHQTQAAPSEPAPAEQTSAEPAPTEATEPAQASEPEPAPATEEVPANETPAPQAETPVVAPAPATAAAPSPFVLVLVEKTDAEWRRFGSAYRGLTGSRSGTPIKEDVEPANTWIREYFANVTNNGWDGKSGYAWSAAFISTCMLLAGAGNRFVKNAQHCYYINDAMRNKDRADAHFQAKRIEEYAPQVGDLVCGWRTNEVSFDTALTVKFGNDPVGVYSSHTDIVTAVRPGELDVVGGNVGNTVTKVTIGLLPNGLIDMNSLWAREKKLFAIMKNNL